MISIKVYAVIACSIFCASCIAVHAAAQPDYRTVMIADQYMLPDVDPAYKALRADLISMFSRTQKNMLHLANDRFGLRTEGYSRDDLSSDEFRKKLCEETGSGWILHSVLFKGDNGIDCYIYLYDYFRDTVHLLSYEKISSYAQLKEKTSRDIEHLYLMISSVKDYFLHQNLGLYYVRDIAEYGFTGDLVSFKFPYGIMMTAGGNLLCAASGTVTAWDANDRFLRSYGKRGEGRGEYTSSMKAASDAAGNVYVLDMSGRIIIYPKSGSFADLQIGSATALFTVTDDGSIIVFDQRKKQMQVLDIRGTELNSIFIQDDVLYSMTSNKNNILLLAGRNRDLFVRYFTSHGKSIRERQLPFKSDAFIISSFKEDAAGNLYLLDMTSRLIAKVTADNRVAWVYALTWTGPANTMGNAFDIAVSADGRNIFVTDSTHKRIVKIKQFAEKEIPPDEKLQSASAEAAKNGNDDRMLACLGAILKKDPMNRAALEKYADFYASQGCYEQALELYRKIYDAGSDDPSLKKKSSEASVALYLRNGDGYSSIVEKLLASEGPDSAKAFYEEGCKQYERALKVIPGNASASAGYRNLKAVYEKAAGTSAVPLAEIASMTFGGIFAAQYKYYGDTPAGSIKLINTTGRMIEKLTASADVKTFMDYPTESRVYRNIAPGDALTIPLVMVFNNKILSVTEDTPLTVRVVVRYTIEGKEYDVTGGKSAVLYNRNALTWDSTEKLASFITPKDTSVKLFSRETVQLFRNSSFSFLNANLQSAIQIFDTAGAYGLTYVQDPKTPFASFSVESRKIDYVQYPRDTLRFKTGDCDDLTALYCALLANIGIDTALITVPGHIFAAFDTGVPENRRADICADGDLVIIRSGTVWIPVETTMIGKGFVDAWSAAASAWQNGIAKKNAEFVTVPASWERFSPVTLDEDASWKMKIPERDAVDRVFTKDITAIIDREMTKKTDALKKRFDQSSGDFKTANEIGVAYARYGRYREAEVWCEKSKVINPEFAPAWVNLGNIYMLTGRDAKALPLFEAAVRLRNNDAAAHITCAILYHRLKEKAKTQNAFAQAEKIDPVLARRYAYLVQKDDGAGRAASARAQPDIMWEDQ